MLTTDTNLTPRDRYDDVEPTWFKELYMQIRSLRVPRPGEPGVLFRLGCIKHLREIVSRMENEEVAWGAVMAGVRNGIK